MLVRFIGRDHPRPWNKGLLVGQKKPLQPKQVWSIRVRLEIARMWRDHVDVRGYRRKMRNSAALATLTGPPPGL